MLLWISLREIIAAAAPNESSVETCWSCAGAFYEGAIRLRAEILGSDRLGGTGVSPVKSRARCACHECDKEIVEWLLRLPRTYE